MTQRKCKARDLTKTSSRAGVNRYSEFEGAEETGFQWGANDLIIVFSYNRGYKYFS